MVGWGPDIADALAPTGYPKPGVQKVYIIHSSHSMIVIYKKLPCFIKHYLHLYILIYMKGFKLLSFFFYVYGEIWNNILGCICLYK